MWENCNGAARGLPGDSYEPNGVWVEVWLDPAATMNGWNHAAWMRKQLHGDDMGRILQQVETGQHPEWTDITNHSSSYKTSWAQ
jgi:hypothetical protein